MATTSGTSSSTARGAAKSSGPVARLRSAARRLNPFARSQKSADIAFDLDGLATAFAPGDSRPRRGPDAEKMRERINNSVIDIADRRLKLRRRAVSLNNAIVDFQNGGVSMLMLFASLFLAAGWAFIAFHLDRSLLTGLPNMFGDMPDDHARILFDAFFNLAMLAAVAAIVLFVVVGVTGSGDDRRLRREADAFGEEAAVFALEFDDALTEVRASMDNIRGASTSADAIGDLSLGNLKALEAAIMFDELGLSPTVTSNPYADPAYPERRFNLYLKNAGARQHGAPLAPLLISVMIAGLVGFVFGSIATILAVAPPPTGDALNPTTIAALYPSAAAAILAPSFVLAVLGILLAYFRDAVTADQRADAVKKALAAVTGQFTQLDAPRIQDLVQRIVDAHDVYIAWVTSGQRGAPAAVTSAALAPGGTPVAGAGAKETMDDSPSATPAWRKSPEGPRFVDTGFAAAPKTFRTDAFAKAFSEKSNPSLTRKSASKRSLFKLKKPD